MSFKRKETEIENPSEEETMSTLNELIILCYETKQTQTAELQLDGHDMGDAIVVTVSYKGNTNANQSLN